MRSPDGLAGAIRTHDPVSGTGVRLASSFVAILSVHDRSFAAGPQLQPGPGIRLSHLVSSDGRAELAFASREMSAHEGPLPGALTLVVGDDSEWDGSQEDACLAHATCVRWNAAAGTLSILSSIVGLPPVYVCRRPGVVIVASALHLLRSVLQLRLTIDRGAAHELYRIGHPLDGRTLFDGVTLMAPGHRLDADTHGRLEVTPQWRPPVPAPADRRPAVEAEADAFECAVRRLRLGGSLFSMTGGLDTRAILAVLVETGARPTACTMTGGRTLCLDARLAMSLCREYGLPHVLVTLGDEFARALPYHVLEASRLSGGLAGVEQAHEVYFYQSLRGLGSRRLSGALGNQVGRQGMEAVSARRADAWVLDEAGVTIDGADGGRHWLEAGHQGDGLLRVLLEREVASSSMANFSVGHHFMIQQTPYADRRLIEIVLASASGEAARTFPRARAQYRDISHRFLGQPQSRSFQRRVVRTAGGAVARHPINWGWRVEGGLSIAGLGWGLLAFADALGASVYPRWPPARRALAAIGADGIHEIKRPHAWLDTILRDFVHDTLQSRCVAESDLFARGAVAALLDEHYRGIRLRHATLMATLDLALAQQLFC